MSIGVRTVVRLAGAIGRWVLYHETCPKAPSPFYRHEFFHGRCIWCKESAL